MARPPKGLGSARPPLNKDTGRGSGCEERTPCSLEERESLAECRLLQLQRKLLAAEDIYPSISLPDSSNPSFDTQEQTKSSGAEAAGNALGPASLWLAEALSESDNEEEMAISKGKEKVEKLRRRLNAHRASPSHRAFRQLTEKLEFPSNAKKGAVASLVDGAVAALESPEKFLRSTREERKGNRNESSPSPSSSLAAAMEALRLAELRSQVEDLGKKERNALRLERVRRESQRQGAELSERICIPSKSAAALKLEACGQDSLAEALERRLAAAAETALKSKKDLKRLSKTLSTNAHAASRPSFFPFPGVTVRLRSVNFCSTRSPEGPRGRQRRRDCKRRSSSRSESSSSVHAASGQLPVVSYCVIARYATLPETEGEVGASKMNQSEDRRRRVKELPTFTTAWYEAFVALKERRSSSKEAKDAEAAESDGGSRKLKSDLWDESCVFETELILPSLPLAMQDIADSCVVVLEVWRKVESPCPSAAGQNSQGQEEDSAEVELAGEAFLDLRDEKCFDSSKCIFAITPPRGRGGDGSELSPFLSTSPRLGTLHACVSSVVVEDLAQRNAPLRGPQLSEGSVKESIQASKEQRSWLYIDDFGKVQGPFLSSQMFDWICDRYFEDSTVVFDASRPTEPLKLRQVAKSIAQEARYWRMQPGRHEEEDETEEKEKRESGGEQDSFALLSNAALPFADETGDFEEAHPDKTLKQKEAPDTLDQRRGPSPTALATPSSETKIAECQRTLKETGGGDNVAPSECRLCLAREAAATVLDKEILPGPASSSLERKPESSLPQPSPPMSAVRHVWRSLEEATRCLTDVRRHRMSSYLRNSIAAPSPEAVSHGPFSRPLRTDLLSAPKKPSPTNALGEAQKHSLSRVYIRQRFKLLRDTFGEASLREACAVYIQAAFRGWRVRRRLSSRRRRRFVSGFSVPREEKWDFRWEHGFNGISRQADGEAAHVLSVFHGK